MRGAIRINPDGHFNEIVSEFIDRALDNRGRRLTPSEPARQRHIVSEAAYAVEELE